MRQRIVPPGETKPLSEMTRQEFADYIGMEILPKLPVNRDTVLVSIIDHGGHPRYTMIKDGSTHLQTDDLHEAVCEVLNTFEEITPYDYMYQSRR